MTPSIRYGLTVLALLLPLLTAPVAAQPVATDYETLSAVYDYDPELPLNAEWDDELQADGVPVRVVFDSVGGERVPALVGLPPATTHGPGPYPAVIFGHGLGGSKDDSAYKGAMMILLQNGFATMLIDFPAHGERSDPALEALVDDGAASLSEAEIAGYLGTVFSGMTQAVKDLRRSVDLLQTIDLVAPERIGYAGLSMGAILGATFSGVDDRLACAALIVGGADWGEILAGSQLTAAARASGAVDPRAIGALLRESDPMYFADHISAPALLVFGGKDDVVPYETAGKLLESLVPEPKTVVVYEESGHLLEHSGDRFQAIMVLNAFLTEHLMAPGESMN